MQTICQFSVFFKVLLEQRVLLEIPVPRVPRVKLVQLVRGDLLVKRVLQEPMANLALTVQQDLLDPQVCHSSHYIYAVDFSGNFV